MRVRVRVEGVLGREVWVGRGRGRCKGGVAGLVGCMAWCWPGGLEDSAQHMPVKHPPQESAAPALHFHRLSSEPAHTGVGRLTGVPRLAPVTGASAGQVYGVGREGGVVGAVPLLGSSGRLASGYNHRTLQQHPSQRMPSPAQLTEQRVLCWKAQRAACHPVGAK